MVKAFFQKGGKTDFWFIFFPPESHSHTPFHKLCISAKQWEKKYIFFTLVGKKDPRGSKKHSTDQKRKNETVFFYKMIVLIILCVSISKEVLPNRITLYLAISFSYFISNISYNYL